MRLFLCTVQTSRTFTTQYGRTEIPAGAGLRPAFWMLGSNLATNPWPADGEIDVMESVCDPGTVHGSLRGPGYSGGEDLTGSYTLPDGAAFLSGFHTFDVDWSASAIVYSVDGYVYEIQTPAATGG